MATLIVALGTFYYVFTPYALSDGMGMGAAHWRMRSSVNWGCYALGFQGKYSILYRPRQGIYRAAEVE